MLDKISAYATVRVWKIKEAVKNFWEEERGDHLVEIILVLVVVVGLAIFFRKQIGDLVNKLWTSITEKTDDFNPDSVISSPSEGES